MMFLEVGSRALTQVETGPGEETTGDSPPLLHPGIAVGTEAWSWWLSGSNQDRGPWVPRSGHSDLALTFQEVSPC